MATRKFLFVDTNGDYFESDGAYEVADFINTSAGVADAGKPIVLDAAGLLDSSFINFGAIDHGALDGLGDDDHTQYILVAGTRAFTGDQSIGGFKLTNLADGTADSDAINYGQLQDAINGFDWKNSVHVATTAALPAVTYDNGTAGVGATLTADADGALPSIDGVSLTVGQSILVKDQAAGLQNGIYEVTALGDGSNPFVLTRRVDADENAEVTSGLTASIEAGTANGDRVFQLTTNDPITVGTTALVFTKLVVNTLTGGAGITLTGETFSADLLASGGLKFVGVGDAGQISVEPADFAGTGLQDDGSDNLEIDFADTSSEMATQRAVAAADLSANGANQGAKILGADPAGIAFSSATTIQGVLEDLDDAIADAATPGVTYTAGAGGVDAGDLVYVSAANTVLPKDITTSTYAIGVAMTSVAAAGEVKISAENAVVTGVLVGATPGDRYYWNGTALTTTIPAGGGAYVWLVGVAKNATDLDLNVEFLKRNSL